MDFIWVLALTSAFGVVFIANAVATHLPRFTVRKIATIITCVLCLHLLQVNRHMFARLYSRPAVPQTVAIAQAVSELPTDAVVATPLSASLSARIAGIGGRTIAIFKKDTVNRLLEQNQLSQAFETYGITHTVGYEDVVIPNVPTVEVGEHVKGVQVSRFMTFLLHIID